MSIQTPNLGLTLPTGPENVSRQIINDNNTIIDGKMGAIPAGQNVQGQIDALNSKTNNFRSLGQVSDANIPTSSLSVGCAHYFYGTGAMSNMPSGVASAWAISGFVFTSTSNAYGMQMLYAYGKVYCRQLSSGSYGAWTTIV